MLNHCDIIGLQSYQIRCKKRKIRAITPFKVIQGHRYDFLLVLIELFSLDVTAEALRVNIGSKSAIRLQWGRLTQNFR